MLLAVTYCLINHGTGIRKLIMIIVGKVTIILPYTV